MSTQDHWNRIYQTKSPIETSWYEPHLQVSLDWITQAVPSRSSAVIDVGGGESTLVDDLYALQYRALTVLDISNAALEKSRARMGTAAQHISWLTGNVTDTTLPSRAYDLWHDRAVFHCLTETEGRLAYVRQLASCLKPGGHAVIAAFGPQGPEKCSGLVTRRYSADALQQELGPAFRLLRDSLIEHETPSGKKQQFLYCDFQLC